MYEIFVWLVSWIGKFTFPKQFYNWIYILIKTLPRDIRLLQLMTRFHWAVKKHKEENATVSKLFSKLVKMHPHKVAIYCEDDAWTYVQVDNFTNKLANYFKRQGYKKGDVIAIFVDNCVQYPGLWLGLSKCGIVAALINVNLVKDSLLHSLNTAGCAAIIFGKNQAAALQEIQDQVKSKKLYHLRLSLNEDQQDTMGAADLLQGLDDVPEEFEEIYQLSVYDELMYIYTSGTTGFPKAALVTHLKYLTGCSGFKILTDIRDNDVYYVPLPLYHSAGSVGIGQSIINGITVVTRKKFSATKYFEDCAKYNVTIGQYIGEICRYLLAVPENQTPKHPLRIMLGNGLRPQIWNAFVDRFTVERVIEVYGSTEGTTFLINLDNTAGSVGFIPRYLKWATGIATIKCDEATGEPFRDKNGLCIECDVGDSGILVGKISAKNAAISFDGYTDKQATKKKLLQNVFSKGDMYFNSGDILEYDQFGNYYFKDRSGDTFRWKGENVSTAEVEAIISNIVHLSDVIVYGVEIPNADGRAGMAAIVSDEKNLNLENLANSFRRHLPKYAIPVFVRIVDTISMTGTFKMKKIDYKEDGYNIHKFKDVVYVNHPTYNKYVQLTPEIYQKIEYGSLRL